MVSSILRMVTMPRNWVEILIKNSALKSYLCPTQCIDCSLMRSCNEHEKMPKWGIFNASVLLNEHKHPPFFITKLKFSYDKYSVGKV